MELLDLTQLDRAVLVFQPPSAPAPEKPIRQWLTTTPLGQAVLAEEQHWRR